MNGFCARLGNSILLTVLTLGASWAFSGALGAEESSALFAPPQKEAAAPPKATAEPAPVPAPAPETQAPQGAPAEALPPQPAPVEAQAPQSVPAETPPPAAAKAAKAPAAPKPVRGGSLKEGRVLVDSKGNKTLVIKGDGDRPAEVMMDDPQGQTQIIFGDDTAGLLMDSRGHKTLVVKGDAVSAPVPLMIERPQGDLNFQADSPSDTPYWIVEPPAEDKPYFMVEPDKETTPYWVVDKPRTDEKPWLEASADDETRPYWLPEPVRVEMVPNPAAENVKVAASAVAPNAVSGSNITEDGKMSISYYKYVDEKGVSHLTNIPSDPRYQLFTVVVQVKRGLGGGYYGRQRFTHESLRPIIMRAALRYNLDPALIAAVIRSESAFDARAVSWAGAQGLMQLMPQTAREMGVTNSFDPEQNIMGGSRYLRLMLNEFGGDMRLAIAAYNAGPARVKRRWDVPNIAETKNYVVIVLRNYERYKGQF